MIEKLKYTGFGFRNKKTYLFVYLFWLFIVLHYILLKCLREYTNNIRKKIKIHA